MLPIIRIWALGVLCILVTIIFVSYNIVEQKETVLGKARSDMDRQVSSLAMDVDRTLFGLSQILGGVENYLEASATGDTLYSPEVQRTLKKLVQENQFLSALVVLNAEGRVVNWSNPGKAPDFSQKEEFSIHTREAVPTLFVGEPQLDLLAELRWGFGVSRGFHHKDGSLARVLVATIDLDYFYNRYRNMLPPHDSVLTISSSEGDIYVRIPDHEMFVGRRIQGVADKISLSASTLAIRQKSPVDNQEYLVAARRAGNFPLVAMVSQQEAAVLESWRQNCLNYGGLGLAVSLLTLLLTIQSVRFQRKQAFARANLHRQAITDPLTALYNRRYVVDQAQLEIKRSQRSGAALSFILLDLDHFKSINDNYGHDAGDRVLIATADILKGICRETDIVSRFGGEEFFLVLTNTELAGAMIKAEKIRSVLEAQVHHYSGKEFQISASFGVSQLKSDETDIREVLLRTDYALYEAKSNGRNRIHDAPAKSAGSYVQGLVSWRYQNL